MAEDEVKFVDHIPQEVIDAQIKRWAGVLDALKASGD